MSAAAPIVSVIVPTYQRPTALLHCLQAIHATVRLPHEVIVVPVKGDEETRRALDGHAVTVVEQPAPDGFVRAANLGFRAASGRYLLQLNDDCRLLPHTVENAVRFLETPAHRDVGQVAFFHDSPVRRNVHAQVQLDDRWFRVLQVRGLCYANFGLVERDLAAELGFYDERFVMYGADPDFSLKVWHDARRRVVPCPGALVEHDEVKDDRAVVDRARQSEDNRRLFEKWSLDP